MHTGIAGRMSAKQVEERVAAVLSVWREWIIFSPLFIFGLEAAFTRSVADTEEMLKPPEEDREVTADELEAVQRRARLAGVALTPSKQGEGSVLEQVTQLERKLKYAAEFVSSRQAPANFDEEDIDGVPYDPDDIDGVPLADDDVRNKRRHSLFVLA